MARANLRTILIGLALAVSAAGLSACGSSSSSSTGTSSSSPGSVSSTTSSGASPVAPVGLIRALLRSKTTPSVSRVICRGETPAQRAQSPFGKTGPPVFACAITAGGAATAYDVQLLPTGCFVAERRTPGKAIYGCGAGKA